MRVVDLVTRGSGRDRSVGRREGPSVFAHEGIDYGKRNRAVEPLELAEDQRAMRPWAGERYIQVIAAGLSLEAAVAARAKIAGARDPIAKAALRAHEMSLSGRRAAVRAPFAVHHDSHSVILVVDSPD